MTVAAFAAVFFSTVFADAKPLHIILDPGHGGTDVGANHDGLKESEIVLKVSRQLALLLKKDQRFKVTLTRQSNETVSLTERSTLARSVKGDVFLSIHANSSIEAKPKGAEIYFQNQLPPDEESRFLASRENKGIEVAGDSGKAKTDVASIIDDLERSYHTHLSYSLVRAVRGGDDRAFMLARTYQTHDLFHLVTGFDTDVAGEMGLQAYYAGQSGGPFTLVALSALLLNTILFAYEDMDRRMDAIAAGWYMGKKSKLLFGVRWENMWHLPLRQVREELRISKPYGETLSLDPAAFAQV